MTKNDSTVSIFSELTPQKKPILLKKKPAEPGVLIKLENIQCQPVDYIDAIAWRILYVLLHEAAKPREVCRDAKTDHDAQLAFYLSTWGCP